MDVRRDETRREEKRQQLTIRGKITIDNKRIDEMTREKKREFMSRIIRPKTMREQTDKMSDERDKMKKRKDTR